MAKQDSRRSDQTRNNKTRGERDDTWATDRAGDLAGDRESQWGDPTDAPVVEVSFEEILELQDEMEAEQDTTMGALIDTAHTDGSTDNVHWAMDQGLVWDPPTDPPVVPSDDLQGVEIAAGFGSSIEEDGDLEVEDFPDHVNDNDADLEDDLRRASQALDIGHAYAEEETRTQSTLLLAQLDQLQGRQQRAQERLHALIAQTKQPHLFREIYAWQARLALAAGHLAEARQWAETQSSQPLPLIQEEAEMLIHARLRLAQGQPEATLHYLSKWQTEAEQNGRLRARLQMLILSALAAHARQDLSHAKQILVQALALAQPEGYQRLFLDAGEPVAVLLRALLRELNEEALIVYVRGILLAFAEEKPASDDTPSVDTALLVEPLSAQERRVLRLLATDLSNPEIASELVVSLNTVKTHIKNIYSKLNVHSRAEARDVARQLKLL